MEFQLHKTSNTTFPLVRDTNQKIIRLWHKSVEEFLQELGINQFNIHQVKMLKRDITSDMTTETAIEFDGQIIGTVKTKMKHTTAGLKFTITCQKVVPES